MKEYLREDEQSVAASHRVTVIVIRRCADAVRGRYHEINGTPCQDRYSVYRVERVVCAALCDGAGSCEFSHFGAEAVSREIAKFLASHFFDFIDMHSADAALRIARFPRALCKASTFRRRSLPARLCLPQRTAFGIFAATSATAGYFSAKDKRLCCSTAATEIRQARHILLPTMTPGIILS